MKTAKEMQDFLEIADSVPISHLLLNDAVARSNAGLFDLAGWAGAVVSGAPGFVFHMILKETFTKDEVMADIMSALVCGFSVKVGSFPVFRARVDYDGISIIFFFFGPHDALQASIASFLQKAGKKGRV